MERPTKTKAKKPSKYLPRASTFSLPTRPANPPAASKGFSGPIPTVPAEARCRRPRNSDKLDPEAILLRSPEVSCMGRVRSRKVITRSLSEKLAPSRYAESKEKGTGRTSLLARLLKGKAKPEREEEEGEQAAGFGEMRRFASGRGSALAGFDWRAHVGGTAAVEPVESPEMRAEEDGEDVDDEK